MMTWCDHTNETPRPVVTHRAGQDESLAFNSKDPPMHTFHAPSPSVKSDPVRRILRRLDSFDRTLERSIARGRLPKSSSIPVPQLRDVDLVRPDDDEPTLAIPGAPEPHDPIYEAGWRSGLRREPFSGLMQETSLDAVAWIAGYAAGFAASVAERDEIAEGLTRHRFETVIPGGGDDEDFDDGEF